MKNYSVTSGGILIAVGGMFLAQIGFSEECSNQFLSIILPLLGAAPGLLTAWWGRVRAGGVKWTGART